MPHKYTVATPQGDVHLTTEKHHSEYKTLGEFIEAHKGTVGAAIGLTGVAVSILGIWLNHGRGGPKL